MKVPFSYLQRQFKQSESKDKLLADLIINDIRDFISTSDFTLGKKLEEFEEKFANLIGVKYALGVGSGTDALILSLKAENIGFGDEVITCAETFIATAGAIAGSGATPVFVDVNDEFTIDETLIENAITEKTKAIMPVYFTGNCPNMDKILQIAKKHDLKVIEDSCCAIDADIKGKKAGSFGNAGAFSFHPLKNLNVFSDGGMVTTNDENLANKIKLLRNHGLKNRDEVEIFGYNSRLDTLQAVVALRMIDDVKNVSDQRINNAKKLDDGFRDLKDFIEIPKRSPNVRQVFHLYMLRVKKRDELHAFLNSKDIEAKIHYPIALPYQQCCKHLNYKKGDFPKTERDCSTIITLPCHQHLRDEEIDYMIQTIKDFYLNHFDKADLPFKELNACTK
ncbi:MAG: dTDP-3-amino-3,4,6-trideoxy-alpha-D-glucose transaminase [Candidatus Anoxychlamydiales bacterium]|nr:dTDP-3-amino-3,4,6-trideoxy-alpha-D-glucose transaminase [Candidatus Anoxychlamydiales bacterium]NGX35513.1 dTDP-3-amino-3,4,6-trideoxy-alpha-D-glucose transaminase [Candidatus Anoxychlamydiales bacterium]